MFQCSTEENHVAPETMGNILQRERKDESIGYAAVIRLKQDGKVLLTETKTFDRRQAAVTWMEERERELAQPGALEAAQRDAPRLSAVIDRHIRDASQRHRRA